MGYSTLHRQPLVQRGPSRSFAKRSRAKASSCAAYAWALDRETGRPRGFAFVETMTDDGAKASIEKLSGRVLQGARSSSRRRRPNRPAPSRRLRRRTRPGGFGGTTPGRRPGPGGLRAARRPGGPAARPGGSAARPSGRRTARNFGPRAGRAASAPNTRGGGRARRAPAQRARAAREEASTRPKPEEQERGNWRWDRNPTTSKRARRGTLPR
jgi:RNA recognition motif-containing protein